MDKRQQIGGLAAKLVQAGMTSGLTWDETVAAFGIASKVLADGAAKDGDGSAQNCHEHAQKRFAEGFAQTVQVEAILANCNTRIELARH